MTSQEQILQSFLIDIHANLADYFFRVPRCIDFFEKEICRSLQGIFRPFLQIKFDILFICCIVFVWSYYDGVIIEQWTIGYGWRQNQEVKLKIVGGAVLYWPVNVW